MGKTIFIILVLIEILCFIAPVTAWDYTLRVSVDSNGSQGNGYSYSPAISPEGQYVAFVSKATNLVPDDTNGNIDDIFVFQPNGDTSLVPINNWLRGDTASFAPSIHLTFTG